MRYIMIALMSMILVSPVSAHQWTPTYPKLKPSFMPDVYSSTLLLFNARSDVEYFEIKVYDKDFNPIKFGTKARIIRVKPKEKMTVDVYIRKEDKDKAVYVCSKSKHVAEDVTATIIASRICSKFK